MVIHRLKPYIVDIYLTEEAVGVVQHLLDQGKGYLSTRPAFVIGTFMSILASLRAFLCCHGTRGYPDAIKPQNCAVISYLAGGLPH